VSAEPDKTLKVINLGLPSFADAINGTGGRAVQVDWRPPAGGDIDAARDLADLVNDARIDDANRKAWQKYSDATPVLEDVARAADVIPDFDGRMLLHAGPPIHWRDVCGPVYGAIIGAIIFEGWAEDQAAAEKLLRSDGVRLAPCHHHACVGPMAGITSPSMPVWVVRNGVNGHRSFANLNEGLGKVLRFGANSPEVIERLKWMQTSLAKVLQAALADSDGLDVKSMMAQALYMGDEVHNRNAAATGLLLKHLAPPALRSGLPPEQIAEALSFIAGNDHFFLNISMAACKAMLDAAHGVTGSSMVTAMARNGVEFGIRVSGCGDRWFTTPAPVVDGLYFPTYSIADAAPDLGDSAITETAGLGGFAMAASPAIVQFVGGTPGDAIARSREMQAIVIGRNNALTIPALNFAGTAAGIDIRKVVDSGILPIINTGIAHKDAGVGQIGAGITRAPMACFSQAVRALKNTLGQ
jgi:hypothetical protein